VRSKDAELQDAQREVLKIYHGGDIVEEAENGTLTTVKQIDDKLIEKYSTDDARSIARKEDVVAKNHYSIQDEERNQRKSEMFGASEEAAKIKKISEILGDGHPKSSEPNNNHHGGPVGGGHGGHPPGT